MKALEETAAKGRAPYEALLEMEELHILYEDEVKHAELALEGLDDPSVSTVETEEEVDEYVSSKLQEALGKQLDTLDLNSQLLSFVPESFGRISSLLILNLSNNRLEVSVCLKWIFFDLHAIVHPVLKLVQIWCIFSRLIIVLRLAGWQQSRS